MSLKSKRASIPNIPIRFPIHVSRPYKWWAFSAILVVIVAAGLSQSLASFFKWIVEAAESGNLEHALFYGLLYPVLVFVVQLLYRLSGWIGLTWAIGVKRQIGDELFEYNLGHSHSYFSNRFAGAHLNKITNVIGAIDSLVGDFLWAYLSTAVTLLVTFYFIFTVDPILGFIFIGLICTLLVLNRFFVRQKMVLSKQVAASGSKLRGVMVDVFSNISAVRQYSARSEEEVRVRALGGVWQKLSIKSLLHTERTLALNAFVLYYLE